MLKTIIIDDERIARNRLKRLLEAFKEIEIIAEADNGKLAVQEINTLKPDLIFLDIQMPELNGFQVLELIEHKPNIIFTTAYDQYALKAFEVNSIDYLLKPIEVDRLKTAIEKANKLKSNDGNYNDLLTYIQKDSIDQLTVRFGDKVLFIDVNDVSYFKSQDKAVILRTLNGKEYIIDYTMTILESRLSSQFVRIHRSFLMNRKAILEATRLGNGKYEFTMKDNVHSKLISSVGYSDNIKQLFEL